MLCRGWLGSDVTLFGSILESISVDKLFSLADGEVGILKAISESILIKYLLLSGLVELLLICRDSMCHN
jgi:hypothetical protein